jgi:hypothetical protein
MRRPMAFVLNARGYKSATELLAAAALAGTPPVQTTAAPEPPGSQEQPAVARGVLHAPAAPALPTLDQLLAAPVGSSPAAHAWGTQPLLRRTTSWLLTPHHSAHRRVRAGPLARPLRFPPPKRRPSLPGCSPRSPCQPAGAVSSPGLPPAAADRPATQRPPATPTRPTWPAPRAPTQAAPQPEDRPD